MTPEIVWPAIINGGIGLVICYLWVTSSNKQIDKISTAHDAREKILQDETAKRETRLVQSLEKRDEQFIDMLKSTTGMLERATMAIVQNSASFGQMKEAVGKLESGVEHLQEAVEKLENKVLK